MGDGSINLTPLRLRVLRIIQQRPWMTAQDLGYALDDCRRGYTPDASWNHPAQATRFGAKQVTPLIKARLVFASNLGPGGYPISAGWKALSLTEAGRRAIESQGERS